MRIFHVLLLELITIQLSFASYCIQISTNVVVQGMVLVACIARARIQMVIIFANANLTAKEMVKANLDVMSIYFRHMPLLP